MKNRTMNMTVGNPTRLLLVFALPMLIGNLFQQMYNLVDSVVVGRFVGTNALAAIGATGSVTFLFFALCNGLGSGGGIVTAQEFGAGQEDRVKSCVVNSGYTLIAGSLLVGCIAFALADPILRLMATPAEILPDSILYMRMMCISLPLVGVYNHVSAMLRALGDSRTPLYFLIFSCIMNIALDIWFVYGLSLGVFGAALATILAQLAAGMGSLIYAVRTNPYFRMKKEHFRPDRNMMWKTLRLGVPLSLQFSLIAISLMVLQGVVNSFGAVVVAAYTAVGRVEQLLHQPYSTLGAALSTYCGQNLGAKKLDRLILGFRKSILLMTVFSLIMLPVMQFFSEAIIGIFVSDPEVIACGATALRITSWFYFALGFINMCRGILNGVGDAMFALLNGGVEVVVRIALPFLLIPIPFVGLWGIWWAVALCWVISAGFCLLRYLSWKRHTLPGV